MAARDAVTGEPQTIYWPEWQADLPGNVRDQAHALTALSPMSFLRAWQLRLKLVGTKLFPTNDLREHHFVYFGRWAIVRPPDVGRLGDRYVLIEANYNGSFSEYLDVLVTDLNKNMKAIWGHSYGCPKELRPTTEFRRFARSHELGAAHYFSAYPDATVKEIEAALTFKATQNAAGESDATTAAGRLRANGSTGRYAGQSGDAAEVLGLLDSIRRALHDLPKIGIGQRLRMLLRPTHPGTQSAVTVVTKIDPEKLDELRDYLERFNDNGNSPFEHEALTAQLRGKTHFARWVIVDRVTEKRDHKWTPREFRPPLLLFGASVHGDPDEYLHALCDHLPDDACKVWWNHCAGLGADGGELDRPALERRLEDDRLDGGLFYAAYQQSPEEIRQALEDYRAVRDVAVARQGRVRRSPPRGRTGRTTDQLSLEYPGRADRADIQGNILTAYDLPYGAFYFLSADGEQLRRWLRDLLDEGLVTSESDQRKSGFACNLAFTYGGLSELGVPDCLLGGFPLDFKQGMEARAEEFLKDPGTGEWGNLHDGLVHVLLMLRAGRPKVLAAEREEHVKLFDQYGLDQLGYEESKPLGSRKDNRQREHFGFADGFSQPAMEAAPPKHLDTAAYEADPDRPLKPGEFLLGYKDEDGMILGDEPFYRNGSFMVVRKLQQHVAAFKDVVAREATRLNLPEDLVRAKIIGRWDNGAPLVEFDSRPRLYGEDLNEFRYGRPRSSAGAAGEPLDDPYGYRCPLGAHIRRTNPRDALEGGAERVRRHRLLRRGMPYGSRVPEGDTQEDGDDRGLLFICFNTSIARQFETVQSWCVDGNLFDVPGEADFLVGTEGRMTVQAEAAPYVLERTNPLVTVRGGGYFFYPSIKALEAIAANEYAGQEKRLAD